MTTYRTYTALEPVEQPATVQVDDRTLPQGQNQVTQQGHGGQVKVTYRVTVIDGDPFGSLTEIARVATVVAQPTIVHVGTKAPPVTSYRTYTEVQPVPQPADQKVTDPALPIGESKTVQQGHPGQVSITYRQKLIDGTKSGPAQVVGRQTTRAATPTIVHVGSKPKPAATWRYDGATAAAVAAQVNLYRTSHGKPGLPHRASPAITPDTNVELHAWGLTSADSIGAAWAASPEHRISILDDFDKIITCGYWTMPEGTKGPYAACTLG